MTDLYNMTLMQNATSIIDIVTAANNASAGYNGQIPLLFPMMFLAIYIMMILMMRQYPIHNAVAVSSYACFVLSLFLRQAELIPLSYVLILGFLTAFATLYLFINKDV